MRGFLTFEDYCKQQFGWQRRQAYNYIAAASVAENVQSTAHFNPSLSQASELSRLEPEQQREVAQAIHETGESFETVSASNIREIVQEGLLQTTVGMDAPR